MGPEPLTAAPSAPAAREARRASPRSSGRSERAAGWRSFSSARGELGCGLAAASSRSGSGSSLSRSAADPVELGVDAAPVDRPSASGHQHRVERRAARPARPARRPPARARGAGRAGSARRSRGRRPACAAPRRSSGSPASSLASAQRRRGVGASAAQPGGHRDALVDRQLERGQLATRAGAEVRQRPGREVVARHARADRRVSAPESRGVGGELVGELDRGEQRADRMHAVLARAAHVEDQVELGVGELAQHGREATHGVAEPRAARGRSRRPAAASRPAAAARRGRRQGGRARSRAPRVASRMSSGAPGVSASEPGEGLAAVREAGVDERHQLLRRRGAAAAQHHERGVHVRLRVEHGAGHLAENAHLAGELGEHRGGAVGLAPQAPRRAAPPPRAAPWRPRAALRAARRST